MELSVAAKIKKISLLTAHMLEAVLENIKTKHKKPICWAIVFENTYKEHEALKHMPIFWNKKQCKDAIRELSSLTGFEFSMGECWMSPKKVEK
jgi:hypothetical protein